MTDQLPTDQLPPEQLPLPPTAPALDPADPLTQLQQRLRAVLLGLPAYFEFNNHISGVNATDLYSLNSLLGASIEGQVVKALNRQRALWDPDDEWLGYTFERQSQAFPDVRLVRKDPDSQRAEIALGIELKGWFLLAKEGEPSFRFTTTAGACAEHDLLVVVPWYLDNVLSGSPVAAEPFVVSARWAAEYRNYYWTQLRRAAAGADRTIAVPAGARPYPAKSDPIADNASHDKGGNFGRVARAEGLMTEWVRVTNETEVLGIRIRDWYLFLKAHSDKADPAEVSRRLAQQLELGGGKAHRDRTDRIATALEGLMRELTGDPA
jgi:hypothetical protein